MQALQCSIQPMQPHFVISVVSSEVNYYYQSDSEELKHFIIRFTSKKLLKASLTNIKVVLGTEKVFISSSLFFSQNISLDEKICK